MHIDCALYSLTFRYAQKLFYERFWLILFNRSAVILCYGASRYHFHTIITNRNTFNRKKFLISKTRNMRRDMQTLNGKLCFVAVGHNTTANKGMIYVWHTTFCLLTSIMHKAWSMRTHEVKRIKRMKQYYQIYLKVGALLCLNSMQI